MDHDLCRLTVAGISWLATDGDSVSEVTGALQRGAEVLRVTPHRRVLRVGGRRPLIVKHFSPRGIAAKLKTFMRRSPAMREWLALRKAIRLALPVPRPVAVGWRHGGMTRESFLVTEALEGSRSMATCLFGKHRLNVVQRRRITREAALVIRQMHDIGLFHKDLHLDNVLVRTGDVFPAVYLIDFQRVAFSRSLNARLRMRNLATLNGGCIEAARSDRLRFLKNYFAPGPVPNGDWRRITARLDELGKRHRRRIWRSRQARCLAENREFKRVRLGSFAGMVRRDQHEGWEARWQEPADCFARATMVTSSDGRTLGRMDLCNRAFYIARFANGGLFHALKNLLASSGAQRAWLSGNSCVMRGVSTATPLACLERRRWRMPLEGYMISESEKGEDLLEAWARCARDIQARRRLIGDFARYIAQMHDCDTALRKLTGKEIIVSGNRSSFAFSLVDFGDVRIGALSRRRRIEHLRGLAGALCRSGLISRTDRLRFLRAYLGVDYEREWRTFGRGLRAQAFDCKNHVAV